MRRITLSLLLISLLPVCMGCGGGAAGTSSARSASSSTLAAYAPVPLAAHGGCGPDVSTGCTRFGVIVAGPLFQYRVVTQASPATQPLIYQTVAATDDSTGQHDPIGYEWMDENRPEWFLKDAAGQRIRFKDYSYLLAVDPGNVEYQQMWALKAIAICQSTGARGVFMDNCNDRYDWNYTTAPTAYPTQESYGQAMDSFISHVSARLHEAGLILVGNVSGQTWDSGRLANWIQQVDGFCIEAVPLYGDGVPQEVDARWLKLYNGFRANPNKIFLQHLPLQSIGEQNYRYAVACFLIWKNSSSYVVVSAPGAQPVVIDPLLEIRIGQPIGDAVNVGGTVYQRDYENGVVYLNMSHDKIGTITLPANLRDSQGSLLPAGPRTLGPHDSLILLKS